MWHQDTYTLKASHRYCVYIQPHLFLYLKNHSLDNFSLFLEYLIQKYEHKLCEEKNVNTLQRATTQYQPKTKDYKRIFLKRINAKIWKKLKELKSLTGFSISYLIRKMIEWEMQETEREGMPTYFTPEDSFTMNSYAYYQSWDGRENEIFFIFWDFP